MDYNQGDIAERYQQLRGAQPLQARVETHSVLTLVGDVTGKTVLDVACGAGYYTRLLRKAGAARVVGMDASDRMIELARAQEAREPLGIEYRVDDARSIAAQSEFDVVVAAWLLVYAPNRAELAKMCRGLASRLRAGGRVVALTINPEIANFDSVPDYQKYGFELTLPNTFVDGAFITSTLTFAGSRMAFHDHYLPMAAFEAAFTEAGLQDFAVHRPELAPDPGDEPGYWDDFLTYPVYTLMECAKPA